MSQAQFMTISELQKNIDLPNLKIIDIREPDEYAREHIRASINLPLSRFSSLDFPNFGSENVLVLCKSGMRTQQAREQLNKIEGKVWCLTGGLDQWKKAGLPTVVNNQAPMEIMRKVQLIASTFILSGSLGSIFISPYFIVLPIIAGSGLLLAGSTGFCPMAKLLSLKAKK